MYVFIGMLYFTSVHVMFRGFLDAIFMVLTYTNTIICTMCTYLNVHISIISFERAPKTWSWCRVGRSFTSFTFPGLEANMRAAEIGNFSSVDLLITCHYSIEKLKYRRNATQPLPHAQESDHARKISLIL